MKQTIFLMLTLFMMGIFICHLRDCLKHPKEYIPFIMLLFDSFNISLWANEYIKTFKEKS